MEKGTIRDVAAYAGVSVGTVSMVLNNSDKVSAETRAKVNEAIKKLHYRRNPYARSLSLNKSHTVGLVITDLSNPFFGVMVGHLQDAVAKHEYSLMLGMTQNSVKTEKQLVHQLLGSGVDGLFIVPAHDRNTDLSHIESLADSKFPTVFLSSHYPESPRNCVMTDLAKGSYEMARHLLSRGCRNILFLSGYRGLVLSESRKSGFLAAHADMDIPVRSDQIIEAEPVFEGGYEAARQALTNSRPDAIMAINDVMCMGVLSYLREEGLRVPGDISVAGYDDLIYSSMLDVPLTTVRQPIRQMCERAVELLYSLMQGGSSESEPILLEPTLIVRASTR